MEFDSSDNISRKSFATVAPEILSAEFQSVTPLAFSEPATDL